MEFSSPSPCFCCVLGIKVDKRKVLRLLGLPEQPTNKTIFLFIIFPSSSKRPFYDLKCNFIRFCLINQDGRTEDPNIWQLAEP